MKIAKLLTAWRVDALSPRFGELREVQDEQQELLDTLKTLLRHFTKTPSTLADTKARGMAHAVISKHEAQA